MVQGAEWLLVAAACFTAAFVNAIAGGGSLVSYPALLAVGLGPVQANVSNTLAIWPGYVGGAVTLSRTVDRHDPALRPAALAAAVGAVGGSAALLAADPDVFDAVVPILVLLGAGLLALPARWVDRLRATHVVESDRPSAAGLVALGLGGAYGAYFGGGLGVILLAILNLVVGGDLRALNVTKAALSLVINTVALVSFAGFGPVVWSVVLAGAPASLLGGVVGGRAAGRIDGRRLRWLVIAFSVAVGLALLVT